jgi:glycosyltransferase involved in cell wall biosynthesis
MMNPAVTFILLAYNQADVVQDAVRAALAQDTAPLEILISDDASTDGTFERIQAETSAYRGPHRVRLNRNPFNLGICSHINRAMELSSGDIVVIAAADDISVPDRVETIVQTFSATNALLVHSDVTPRGSVADVAAFERTIPGILFLADWDVERCATSMSLYIGATGAWRRELFDQYGALPQKDCYEDLILGFRAALSGRVAHVARALVEYRVGQGVSASNTTLADLNSYRTARLQGLAREMTVLQQRLQDARTQGRTSADSIVRHIELRLVQTRLFRDAIEKSPKEFSRSHGRNPIIGYWKHARLNRKVRKEFRRLTQAAT